jgi:carboxymethylenebutenolidase
MAGCSPAQGRAVPHAAMRHARLSGTIQADTLLSQQMREEFMVEVVREPVQFTSFDGERIDAFLHRPSSGPAPGLVMIHEIFGINLPLREIAALFATEGFAVLTVDVFSRMERGLDLDYGEEGHAKGRAMHKAFDYATGVKDLQAGISFLRARPECNGKVGVTGFCLGGTMAYLAASRTDAEAAVGYYGTRIHLFTAEGKDISKPLILHFGELDHTTPPELLQGQILPAIKDNPNVQAFVYPGLVHAFANHRRPDTYNAEVTKVANTRTFAHFRKWLA